MAGFSAYQPCLNIGLASAGVGAAVGVPYGGWRGALMGAEDGPLVIVVGLGVFMLLVWGGMGCGFWTRCVRSYKLCLFQSKRVNVILEQLWYGAIV